MNVKEETEKYHIHAKDIPSLENVEPNSSECEIAKKEAVCASKDGSVQSTSLTNDIDINMFRNTTYCCGEIIVKDDEPSNSLSKKNKKSYTTPDIQSTEQVASVSKIVADKDSVTKEKPDNRCAISFSKSVRVTKQPKTLKKIKRTFVCLACQEIFPHERDLKTHLFSNYILSLPETEISEGLHKRFKCRICEKLFSFEDSLEQHLKEKHSDAEYLFCHMCGKKFEWLPSFNYHLETDHGQQPVF